MLKVNISGEDINVSGAVIDGNRLTLQFYPTTMSERIRDFRFFIENEYFELVQGSNVTGFLYDMAGWLEQPAFAVGEYAEFSLIVVVRYGY